MLRSFLLLISCAWVVSLASADQEPPAKNEPTAPAVADPVTTLTSDADLEAEAARIRQLVRQLGDDSYLMREESQRQLRELGLRAYDVLKESVNDPDPEIASQVQHSLRRLVLNWTTPRDLPELQAVMAEYPSLPLAKRLERIEALTYEEDDAALEVLMRLSRYALSELEAKTAALTLIQTPFSSNDPQGKQRLERLRPLIHVRPTRSAVKWLQAWALAQSDAAAGARRWQELIDEELVVHREQRDDSRVANLEALYQELIATHEKGGATDQLAHDYEQLIAVEEGQPATFLPLLRYLIARQAWEPIAKMQVRWEKEIERFPLALYHFAEAERQQGHAEKAQTLAKRALELPQRGPAENCELGRQLDEVGLDHWAEFEYQHAIANDQFEGLDGKLYAAYSLATRLHDRERDQEAAKLRYLFEETMEKGDDYEIAVKAVLGRFGTDLKQIQAVGKFYEACHYGRQGDHAKEKELLHEAIKLASDDTEAMIQLFHVPNLTEDERADIHQRIKDMIGTKQALIRGPNNARPMASSAAYDHSVLCNELAWLIANTEGDFDEAVQLGQTAVALQRKLVLQTNDPLRRIVLGGHYDTLAHAYAAKQDWASAVKAQAQAVRLDPYSTQVRKAFNDYQAKLAAQGSGK